MSVAIVTGGSRGLGRALAEGLARRAWDVVTDARDGEALDVAASAIRARAPGARVVPLAGDITDAGHRRALVDAAYALGGLDLLVCNAGILGPSPLPALADLPIADFGRLLEVYPLATLGLVQAALPLLRAAPGGGRVMVVSSDAAVEAYRGWGGYGAAKAAADQLAHVLGEEEPGLRVWAVDPGDMRTDMHQAAFPGEDISDRPSPEEVMPALLALVESEQPSGRVRAAELRPA